jgi:prepilin-type N-terminal cleavage/methylation domain-containing protein
MQTDRQRGFTLLEMMVVIGIIMVVSAMTIPKMLQIIDSQKLQSSAQAYAGLLQQARARAVQDNTPYQVLTTTNYGAPMAYVDLSQNQTYNPGGSNPDPAVQLANPIVITDTGAPAGFDTTTFLNIIPLNLETTPAMLDSTGASSPGLAFSERGLPCQRTGSGTAACKNSTTINAGSPPVATTTLVAWVTYMRYTRRSSSGYNWAAVTVTPAGRIRVWTYQNTDATHGSWQ